MNPDKAWISYAEAARILQVTPAAAKRIADDCGLTVRRLPGCNPRVLRAEVLKLLAESVSPSPRAAQG